MSIGRTFPNQRANAGPDQSELFIQIFLGKVRPSRTPRRGPSTGSDHCSGAFIEADVDDTTIYLSDNLTGSARDELLGRRYSDRAAISYATARGIDDDEIDAGTWPPEADLDAISDLARRGLSELGRVDLT